MHDLNQKKTSESFSKIKESIVLKIQKTFEKQRIIAESIRSGVEQTFSEPELETGIFADDDKKGADKRNCEMK